MDCNIDRFKLLHCIQKLPLWMIVEYAWAHKMIDILEAVAADEELSLWPEVDLETLLLEESWRLRVASAQAYSIVRKRDVGQFEKVLALLDATHRLVPRLVSPLKHMKIMFGLKTMIVMWMLKNDRGIVDTVVKIIQYFPSKLPQYREQCSCHDMYLMRKNHQDFKTLAQTLIMDKNKLQDYIMEQMEEQYGERYAHRLQDRLLRYLQELEAVLPRQTYIDELLKEERPPRTEEERLLSEVMITFDATSLKRLLHCVLASSSPGSGLSQKAHDQVAEMSCVSSSKAAAAQHARPSEVTPLPAQHARPSEVTPLPTQHARPSEVTPLPTQHARPSEVTPLPTQHARPSEVTPLPAQHARPSEVVSLPAQHARPSEVTPLPGQHARPSEVTPLPAQHARPSEVTPLPGQHARPSEVTPLPAQHARPSEVTPLPAQHARPSEVVSLPAQHARPSEVVSLPVERRAALVEVEVEPQDMRTMDDDDDVARHLPEDSPLLLEDEEDEDSVEEGRSQQSTTDKEPYKEVDNVAEGHAMETAESESPSGASDVDERARDGKESSAAGTRRDEEEEEEAGEREMLHAEEGDDDKENENSEERRSDDSARQNVPSSPRFWCKRHRWVKSILHECSDEQLQVQHDIATSPPTRLFRLTSSTSLSSPDLTPPSPLFSSCPLVLCGHPDSSTSSSGDLTPSLTFSCPLVRSHPTSPWTSTPPEAITTARDSNKTSPRTDNSGSGIVGPAPTVLLRTEPALQLSSSDGDVVFTLSSPAFRPLKYSTASGIDFPAFSTSSQPSTIPSRQHHALSFLPEPVASSTYSHTLSNRDATMSQNAPSTSASWPAPTRRPLSRLSRRFQRNHLTASRQQHSLSNTPELVAFPFPYSYTLSSSNRASEMSQDDSTSTSCVSQPPPPPRRPLSRLSRRFRRDCSVVCRSQASTPFDTIPERSGTHRRMTSPLFFTESNFSVYSTPASAPNVPSWTLSEQAPLSSEPSSIHSQPVAVPQTGNSVLSSSPCVQLDLNAGGLNAHPAQTTRLPCPPAISQHSVSQIAGQADRTPVVRMSPQCQSALLQSKLLQPLVRLTRLSRQECSSRGGVTAGRSPTLEEEDGNNEARDGRQDHLSDVSFNINCLYSSDESFNNEDSHDSDPDYIPSMKEKKQRVQLREDEGWLH